LSAGRVITWTAVRCSRPSFRRSMLDIRARAKIFM
jgi:hypothetical protein